MWSLFRALPILIGDRVPNQDDIWDNFFELITIMDYVFAPKFTEPMIEALTGMIQSFLANYKRLYRARIILKLHYMVHLPSWIKK